MQSLPPGIDLTTPQQAALHAVFARYADRLQSVGVYGSRVQGRARPGSDVDLVVYGCVTADDIAQIRQDLDDSDLSIFSNVTAYESIAHVPLKQQIDKWMKPLFGPDELSKAG